MSPKLLIATVLLGLVWPVLGQEKALSDHQQHSRHGVKCGSHLVDEYLRKTDPEYANKRAAIEAHSREIQNDPDLLGALQARVYVIPVVVHVVHKGEPIGTGTNISDEQVRSAITALNEDFRKKPGSRGDGIGVDTEIEFCLASKDPNGNTTSGIMRVNGTSVSTYNTCGITAPGISSCTSPNESSVKALSRWNNTKYYNIWVVSGIDGNNGGGGVQGFAYFPGAGSDVDGAVVLYNAFGTTGNVKSYTKYNRVTTHELGHGLNLYHTFQGGSCSEGDCNTQGDRVCDTPPTVMNSGCSSSCSGAMVQNYMDYTSETCQNAFTAGQTTRMRAVLFDGIPQGSRGNLSKDANLSASGCLGNAPPFAGFDAETTEPCQGIGVKFTDKSVNAPTTWNWTFQGGTPATSTAQNPTVTYSGPGPYWVKLKVTNANGADSLTKSGYITPKAVLGLPFDQGFEGSTFPPTGWQRTTSLKSSDTLWSRSTAASGFGNGTAAAVLKNFKCAFYVDPNALSLPPLNFSTAQNPRLTFDVAYERYFTSPTDSVTVYASDNCGQTWTATSYGKGYQNLYTSQGSSGNWGSSCDPPYRKFTPSASQWRKETVDLSAYAGKPAVLIKIQREPHGAGEAASDYLWIDNVHVDSNEVVAPESNFTADKTQLCQGNEVQFTDQSLHTPSTWSWTFPGGKPATSTQKNPKVTYDTTGVYDVILTVTNSGGSDTKTRMAYIQVDQVAKAGSISAADNRVCSGTTTELNATSPQGGLSWQYKEDGGSWTTFSTSAGGPVNSPSLLKKTDFRLVAATAQCGKDTSNVVSVGVDSIPIAHFTASDTTPSANQNVQFNNQSAAGMGYLWKFGDGNTSTQFAPTHKYQSQGLFTVDLQVNDGNCTGNLLRQNYIKVGPGVGVFTPSGTPQIKVFPQPAHGYVLIQNKSSETIRVLGLMDLSGRKIEEKEQELGPGAELLWDLKEITPGLYTLVGTPAWAIPLVVGQ